MIVCIVQLLEMQIIKMYPINGKIIQTRLYELILQSYCNDDCLNSLATAAGSLIVTVKYWVWKVTLGLKVVCVWKQAFTNNVHSFPSLGPLHRRAWKCLYLSAKYVFLSVYLQWFFNCDWLNNSQAHQNSISYCRPM